jgi:hypothetical protein
LGSPSFDLPLYLGGRASGVGFDQLAVASLPVTAVIERGLERAVLKGDRGRLEAGVGAGARPGQSSGVRASPAATGLRAR